MFCALISCIENTFGTQIYKKMWNTCDVYSFINSYFIRQHIYLYVKHVFNAWLFVCKMYEPVNEQTLHNFHY
jgi:hypothetical protein